MRALLGVADEPGAVKGRRCGDPVGKARRRGERIGSAHAIAVGPDRAGLRLAVAVGEVEHRGDVVHHRRDRHPGAHRPHPLALGAPRLEHVGPEDRVAAGAVVEVGQQHKIADRRQPARHVAQLLADAGRVHQQQRRRKRPAALGPADKGLHRAVPGGDVQGVLDHRLLLIVTGPRLSDHPRRPQRGDLAVVIAEALQDLVGMLAEQRGGTAVGAGGFGELDRRRGERQGAG